MKIHEIIYEQVTETFVFTETFQNIENPEVLLCFTVVVVRVSDKALSRQMSLWEDNKKVKIKVKSVLWIQRTVNNMNHSLISSTADVDV